MKSLIVESDCIRKQGTNYDSLNVDPDYIRKQGTNYGVPHGRA